MYSIFGIHLDLYLEKASLVFTSKISFLKQSMLISNQNTMEIFKGVILTIFLACFLVGVESRYKYVEWCSQVHHDQLDELYILLLVVIYTFSQFIIDSFDTCQIVLHSLKGMRIKRDQLFLQPHDMDFIDYVEQPLQLPP